MNPPANAKDIRDLSSIPGWGRSPGGGHDNPLQYSCLEKPMHKGERWATVHGIANNQIWLKWFNTCMHSWFTILYWFQVYVGVIQWFLQIIYHYRLLEDTRYSSWCYYSISLLLICFVYGRFWCLFLICLSPCPSPFGNHMFVFYVCYSVSVLYIH